MRGVVVAPEPRAAEVGADVLRDGGNAFDAAVATAFAQTVLNPFQCGLGGWGGALLHDARTGAVADLAFPARIGSRMSPDMWSDDVKGYTDVWSYPLFEDNRTMIGYTAVMTPGTVTGLGALHERFARLPWAQLLEPAIELSDRGFDCPEYIAMYCRMPYMPGLPHPQDKYCATAEARRLFMRPDGRMLERGDPYRNPDVREDDGVVEGQSFLAPEREACADRLWNLYAGPSLERDGRCRMRSDFIALGAVLACGAASYVAALRTARRRTMRTQLLPDSVDRAITRSRTQAFDRVRRRFRKPEKAS